ncbi:MAG: hypothetical protein P8P34_04860 [Flavobacteriaceae bacterium]|nr:hypothetical protein [Flavobacteriaceae bacterium]
MKLPNFLIHTFAAVGVISLIFWSCAAADSDNIDNPPQITSSVGKYQISNYSSSSATIAIINTETGVLKSYFMTGSTWYEVGTQALAGENGNITATH